MVLLAETTLRVNCLVHTGLLIHTPTLMTREVSTLTYYHSRSTLIAVGNSDVTLTGMALHLMIHHILHGAFSRNAEDKHEVTLP